MNTLVRLASLLITCTIVSTLSAQPKPSKEVESDIQQLLYRSQHQETSWTESEYFEEMSRAEENCYKEMSANERAIFQKYIKARKKARINGNRIPPRPKIPGHAFKHREHEGNTKLTRSRGKETANRKQKKAGKGDEG